MNKLLYFIGYDAIGDYLSNNGMIRYLLNRYDQIILVSNLIEYLKLLFNDNNRISFTSLGEFETICNENLNFDVIDVRVWNVYPKPGKYNGFYFNKENKINSFSNSSFTDNASYFYDYMGIDTSIKLNNFYFSRLFEKEKFLFKKLNLKQNKYSVICEYGDNLIKKKYINDKNLINLHHLSSDFLDVIKVIENAAEIHLIENSIALLVYHLQYKNLMKLSKVNLHVYSRQEPHRKCTDIINGNIYLNMLTSPKLQNWNFIYQ